MKATFRQLVEPDLSRQSYRARRFHLRSLFPAHSGLKPLVFIIYVKARAVILAATRTPLLLFMRFFRPADKDGAPSPCIVSDAPFLPGQSVYISQESEPHIP